MLPVKCSLAVCNKQSQQPHQYECSVGRTATTNLEE